MIIKKVKKNYKLSSGEVPKKGKKNRVVKKIRGKRLIKNLKKSSIKSRTNRLRLTKSEKDLLAYHKTLKLQIELVPLSCWFSNTRNNVKQSEWDRIRKPVYAKANYLCEICGGKGTKHPVECHEVWIYNDKNLTQTLNYFQAVCPLCHEVKHIGRAGILGNGERALNRFKKVNRLNKETATKIVDVVFKEWEIRSEQKWKLDISLLEKYGIDTSSQKKYVRKNLFIKTKKS